MKKVYGIIVTLMFVAIVISFIGLIRGADVELWLTFYWLLFSAERIMWVIINHRETKTEESSRFWRGIRY